MPNMKMGALPAPHRASLARFVIPQNVANGGIWSLPPTDRAAVAPPIAEPARLWPARTRRGQAVLGCVSLLGLFAVLCCGSPPVSTQNPRTLWVNFGQSELDLLLVESEPPYY